MSNENYATWNVRLWLDNDETLYSECRECAEEIRTKYATRNERVHALAVLIREAFETAVSEIETTTRWVGAFQDILNHAGIDWERVADLFAGELFNDEENE